MWAAMVISAAFFNALWTSLSRERLSRIHPLNMTLLFRGMVALLFLPISAVYFLSVRPSYPLYFYLLAFLAGVNEGIRIYVFFTGVKRDYYSTYSLTGLSPLFVLLLAPGFLQEKINVLLAMGILCVTAGGVIFYRLGQFMPQGVYCAFASAVSGIIAKSALKVGSPLVYPFFSFVTASLTIFVIMKLTGNDDGNAFSKERVKMVLPLSALSFLATVLNYSAISIAPITKVNPLIRLNLLFGFFFSYFIAGEREAAGRRLLAGVLIFTGVIMIIKA